MRLKNSQATNRLLHDLAAMGRMQAERPSAAERVEALLGLELAGVLRTSIVGEPGPAHGLRPRRAA
jgi:hypothetical protein